MATGSMKKVEQIHNSFTYHKPTDETIPKYEKLRESGKQLALMIADLCPDSRETSVAITKLEESIMWANKAIACNSASIAGGSQAV